MNVGKTLHVTNRTAWRAWLRKNHAREREIWLVYHRKATGKKRIDYNDAVEEALCFGWIDSTLKGLDEERLAQRFSPRRKGAKLSALNRERVGDLIARRKMTKAGLDAIGGAPKPARLVVPPAVHAALGRSPAASREFKRLPESYKRIRMGYIEAGRKHGRAEYAKRVKHFVEMTGKGKRFGFWTGRKDKKKG